MNSWEKNPDEKKREPIFDFHFNMGHVLTIVSMLAAMLGVWRSVETRAVETAGELRETKNRLDKMERNQEEFLKRVETIALNQERTAVILDNWILKK